VKRSSANSLFRHRKREQRGSPSLSTSRIDKEPTSSPSRSKGYNEHKQPEKEPSPTSSPDQTRTSMSLASIESNISFTLARTVRDLTVCCPFIPIWLPAGALLLHLTRRSRPSTFDQDAITAIVSSVIELAFKVVRCASAVPDNLSGLSEGLTDIALVIADPSRVLDLSKGVSETRVPAVDSLPFGLPVCQTSTARLGSLQGSISPCRHARDHRYSIRLEQRRSAIPPAITSPPIHSHFRSVIRLKSR